jgi:hypothetical protein
LAPDALLPENLPDPATFLTKWRMPTARLTGPARLAQMRPVEESSWSRPIFVGLAHALLSGVLTMAVYAHSA